MKEKYNKAEWWEICKGRLKREYQEKGILRCELQFDDCLHDFALAFHHRHKRWWYINKPDLLGYFNQTVLACVNCHGKVEGNRELNEFVFKNLRKGSDVPK